MPPILWAYLIYSFSNRSTVPGAGVVWWDFILKKSAHMTIYSILFYLVQRAINWNKTKKTYFSSLIITFVYAVTDEFHQSFIPGRTSLPTDVGYDMIGASLTMLKLKNII